MGGPLQPGLSEHLLPRLAQTFEFLGGSESVVRGVVGKIRGSSHGDAWR